MVAVFIWNWLFHLYCCWNNLCRFAIVFCLPHGLFGPVHKWIINKVHDVVRKNWYQSQIKDKNLLKKLTPTFPLGCKRITPSDDYLARSCSLKCMIGFVWNCLIHIYVRQKIYFKIREKSIISLLLSRFTENCQDSLSFFKCQESIDF